MMNKNNYWKLLISCVISFFVMYGVMFLNVDSADHIYLSLTRFYMSLLMVCPMALIMLGIMRDMYMNRNKNGLIIVFSIVLFFVSLTLLRSQTPVTDVQYMKAMIPHHSSAIMTSKHAKLKDPQVRQLADSIIQSQEREIRLMKSMLKNLQ